MKALQAAMYAHQTLLLQHRMEFLQSELKQARLAYEMIINKQMELTHKTSAAAHETEEKQTSELKQDGERDSAVVDEDDDDDTDSRSSTSQSSGLTHRQTARAAVST